MLAPSLALMIAKLSKLQREFLIDHVDGVRPFIDQQIENMTRESMIARGLVRYHPQSRSHLGRPDGTALTNDGREALCTILGQYADALCRAVTARRLTEHTEANLLRILTETATHWSSSNAIQRAAADD